ncbi:ABC transporter permease [Fusibacter tunisiensis]|uniref:ABC-type transport system involved in multi-copper enzyme maturation permease subunit n=1 Tax=Fusibacter tunisiensis TaxID=1008308 RepID=A0ABS2MTK0_9FIRM|nr:ABC transporter permease [Fusibacter tunisiensis]MBM7562732.1 ABC-type transport system involved in multi-copper enzyme maturation permease subunit [Fusibacter tunisiensis]
MLSLLKIELYKLAKFRKNRIVVAMLIVYIFASIGFQYYQSKTYLNEKGAYFIRLSEYSGVKAAAIDAEISNLESLKGVVEPRMSDRLELFTNLTRAQSNIGFFMQKEEKSNDAFIVYSQVHLFQSLIDALERDLFTEEEILQRNYHIDDLKQDLALAEYWNTYKDEVVLNPYTVTGVSGLRAFFSYENLFILTIFIIFIVLDVFLIESSGGTYKLIMTLPKSRLSIYVSKVLTMIIASVILLTGAILLRFSISVIIGGLGNWADPVVSRESLYGLSIIGKKAEPIIISSSEYILKGFILLNSVMYSFIFMLTMVAVLTDKVDQTLFIVFSVLLLTFILGTLLQKTSPVHMWYPFMGLFVSDVIQVTKQTNFILCNVLNLILGAVSLLIGGFYFKQKDFTDKQ